MCQNDHVTGAILALIFINIGVKNASLSLTTNLINICRNIAAHSRYARATNGGRYSNIINFMLTISSHNKALNCLTNIRNSTILSHSIISYNNAGVTSTLSNYVTIIY